MSSTTIKTQYQDIHSLLLDNKGKKITDKLISSFVELMKSKVMAKTFKKDDKGNLTHVFCYYHKEWEDITEVDFGKKASTSTGLNSMCKQGVSHWTKQQRVMKKAKADLLDKVSAGEIVATDIPQAILDIGAKAKLIEAYEVPKVEVEETKD